jgi:leucyl/phenylalanyl-tRNA--protein transferase
MLLNRVVMKLFLRPETVICCALNSMAPSPERVISNYCQGMVLFGEHRKNGLVWKAFPERAIITPESAHLSRRLKEYMRRDEFGIRFSENFEGAIRESQRGKWTWINEPLIEIYIKLFSMGFAQSIEAYHDEQLVGGLWGLAVGNTFSVMSMFHQVDRAGAIALGILVKRLMDGELGMVDCGLLNSNFARFGAQVVSQEKFIEKVAHGLARSVATLRQG